MGSCISLPSLGRHSEKIFQLNNCFEYALYATQGQRATMEDTNVICPSLPNHPSYSLFGVFDGFNGQDASRYISENIVNTLDTVTDLEDNDAIINAINQMDHNWIHSKQFNVNSGTTFVLALINTINNNNESTSSIQNTPSSHQSHVSVYTSSTPLNESEPLQFPSVSAVEDKGCKVRIFWAGDSRAMLMSHDCQFQDLTVDHHCDVEEEAERIKNADGTIKNHRIDGICEVTRGFGCYVMKSNADLPSNKQKMIAESAHTSLICTQNDTLLLFCDGLYKKWTDKELKNIYKHHALQQVDEKKGLLYASMYLAEQAMDEGSPDNITLLSVKFK